MEPFFYLIFLVINYFSYIHERQDVNALWHLLHNLLSIELLIQ